jgi:hypothetical protein
MAKKIFQRLFGCIILILVLQIVMVLLDKASPMSILFHQTIIYTLRTLVIGWFVLALLLDIIFIKSRKVKRTGWLAIALLFVVITVGEFFSASWMKHPDRIPGGMLTGYRCLYAHNYMNVIQIIPECSEYDTACYYNLKAHNTCTYSNVEFSNAFITNAKGFRDDDASLVKPEVICLGDSYIMGWGVNQQETIPAVLEKLTGKKVLNAGMSSFGTAREMMRFATLDTSALQYLVIQYCPNDNDENKVYIEHNNYLPISSQASYDSLKFKSNWNKRYFPGKYFLIAAKHQVKESIKSMMGKPPSIIGLPIEYPRDAKWFLDILKVSPVNFHKTKTLVFVGVDLAGQNKDFKNAVDKLLQEPAYKDHFGGNLQVVDVSGLLTKDDYYILDGHFNKSGHQKIAQELATYIH